MKIKLVEFVSVAKEVTVEFVTWAYVPSWLTTSNCAKCRFPINEGKDTVAAKAAEGRVLYFHADCFRHAITSDREAGE